MARWIEDALEGKTVAVELRDNAGHLAAQVYERTRSQQVEVAENGGKNSPKRLVEWEERAALVHSENVARAAEANRRRYEVAGLLTVKIESWATTKTVNAKRGRTAAGKKAEKRVVEDRRYEVAGVSVDEITVAGRVKRLGWRVAKRVTNCAAKEPTVEQIIAAYYGEWRVEHVLRRLKGRTLSIAPVYVRDEKQTTLSFSET